jgi:Arc/MetJ family transcription regulator
LIPAAMRVSGLKTKRSAVEEGLRLLIRLKGEAEVLSLFGQVRWQGDLDDGGRGLTLV